MPRPCWLIGFWASLARKTVIVNDADNRFYGSTSNNFPCLLVIVVTLCDNHMGNQSKFCIIQQLQITTIVIFRSVMGMIHDVRFLHNTACYITDCMRCFLARWYIGQQSLRSVHFDAIVSKYHSTWKSTWLCLALFCFVCDIFNWFIWWMNLYFSVFVESCISAVNLHDLQVYSTLKIESFDA